MAPQLEIAFQLERQDEERRAVLHQLGQRHIRFPVAPRLAQ